MFSLSSVRVCVCVFIYKQLFVLRELGCAKLQTNLAGGGNRQMQQGLDAIEHNDLHRSCLDSSKYFNEQW